MRFKKIIQIILFFLVGILGVSLIGTYIFFMLEKNMNNTITTQSSFANFALYILGYGDMPTANPFLQFTFGMVGVLMLALLSSCFTATLFSWVKEVRLSKNIVIWENDNEEKFASILIGSISKNLFKVSLTMQYFDEEALDGKDEFIEYTRPVLMKNEKQRIDYKLTPGNLVYDFLRGKLKESKGSSLVAVVTYIDSTSGQESIYCKEYKLEDFIVSDITGGFNGVYNKWDKWAQFKKLTNSNKQWSDFCSWINDGITYIALNNTKSIIDGVSIDKSVLNITTNISEDLKTSFRADVNFKEHLNGAIPMFVMVLVKNEITRDWTSHYDMDCTLEFDITVSKNIIVTLEIKNGDKRLIIDPALKIYPSKSTTHVVYRLQTLDRSMWESVDELCFTVLKEDISKPTGNFTVSDLKLVAKS